MSDPDHFERLEVERPEIELPDHAGVAFPPPVMLISLLIAGFGLRYFIPAVFLPDQIAMAVGPTAVALSLTFFSWAVVTMRRGGGSIPTGEPTDVILSHGPYRFSRNPIYVAMIALLMGTGIWANSLWFVGFAVLAVILLSWGVISREEAYLERKFGDQYSDYKSKVRQWL